MAVAHLLKVSAWKQNKVNTQQAMGQLWESPRTLLQAAEGLSWARKTCWTTWLKHPDKAFAAWRGHPGVQGAHSSKWRLALWAPWYVHSMISYSTASSVRHVTLSPRVHFKHTCTVSSMLLWARRAVWSTNMLFTLLLFLEAYLCLRTNSWVGLSNTPSVLFLSLFPEAYQPVLLQVRKCT